MMKKMTIFVMLVLLAGCIKENHTPLADEDARLVTLLNQADSCKTDGNHGQCFRIYQQIAEEYEQKNLTDLQKRYLQKMLTEAEAVGTSDPRRGAVMKAEALQQMATALMVGGQLDSALMAAHDACRIAPRDTIDFCAQTLLLLAQIHLMNDAGDSVVFYIEKAERTDPAVRHTDLYRIIRLYGLDLQHRYAEMMALLPGYIKESGIHARAEMVRLRMYRHEETLQWQTAYADAIQLMEISDSIAKAENAEHTAQIHALQHERQMELQRAVREAERARMFALLSVVLLLLLAASLMGLFYRRKARIAHAKELEALRLSEMAQANESNIREENIRLQRLYYEHLYAIILPILNAHRGKSGHINLEESSWVLIEKNTDMVLPGFTSRLRKQHPTLTTEDVRFCCLLMMRVPNALLADVYGIAPSSVAVRKQRMKKKLDSDVQNQTIENYLNQYIK